MNISKQSCFFLSTAVLMDAFLTGGTTSLAITGIGAILQSLPDVGANVLCGLATNQLSKEPELNRQLEEAFQKAVSQTIESVKNDFIEEKSLNSDWWRQKSVKFGFSIPDLQENFTLKKSLENHFFFPLERALQNEVRIKNILEDNLQLDPAALIEKVLESETICLPEFRKEHEEGVRKALIDGFKDRFRFHLLRNLHKSETARKAYQTQLLENSIIMLSKIGQNVDSLLDIGNLLGTELINIEKRVLENREEMLAEFQKLRHNILEKWELKLTRNQVRTTDIRDQFSFKSLYTTFQGRYDAIETLMDFLMDQTKFLFYAISGPGGAGKSRLANEICLRAEGVRWIAGFCDQDKNQNFDWDSFKTRTDTLVILDYVKSDMDKVSSILETLASLSGQNKLEHKIRVILLEREFDDDLRQSLFNSKTRSHYFSYVLNEEEKSFELSELEEEARWEIIKQVISESDEKEIMASIISRKKEILKDLDLQDPQKRPLFAFFSAVALREGADIAGWNTNDNLSYHLVRLETRVWSQNKLWLDVKVRGQLKNLIWLGAILGYLSYEDLEKIAEHILFKKLAEEWGEPIFWKYLKSLFMLEGSMELQDGVPGMKPDLLAEFFVVKHIATLQEVPMLEKQLNELYDLAWYISPERVWWMSWLTFSNYFEQEFKSLNHYLNWLENSCKHDSLYFGYLFLNLSNLFLQKDELEKAEGYLLKANTQGVVPAIYNLAKLYRELGKPDKSEKYYLKAISNGDLIALNGIASLYQEQGKIELAEKYYLEAISKDQIVGLFNVAIFYTDLGKLDQAEEYYLRAIAKGHVKALNNLANLYKKQSKLVPAERYYLEAISSGEINAINNLGALYVQIGKLSQAEELFLLAISKGNIEANYNLARLYQEQGDAEKSEVYYLIASEKGHMIATNNLANIYREQGKLDQAEIYYKKAIDQGYIDAIFNLANLYYQEGEYVKSEEFYKKAIVNGDNGAYYNLAILYQALDNHDEAEKCYLIAIAQGNVPALNNLGKLYHDDRNFKEAEKYYLQAIDYGIVDSHFNLALLYEEQGGLIKAEKHYKIAISKGHIVALNNLGNFYKNSGKFKDAEVYYSKAIERGYYEAYHNLANLNMEVGKFDKAELYYLEAIKHGTKSSNFNLATLYQDQNKFVEAEKYYLNAIKYGDLKAHINLAILFHEQGYAEKAEAQYLIAIKEGDIISLFNLSILYWETNQKKQDAWRLINEYLKTNHRDILETKIWKLIISAWAFEFCYLEERELLLYEIEKQPELFYLYFRTFYHDHSDFLLNEFEVGKLSKYLKVNYPHYLFTLLHFNRPNDSRLTNIPEVLNDIYKNLVVEIEEKRMFYGIGN